MPYRARMLSTWKRLYGWMREFTWWTELWEFAEEHVLHPVWGAAVTGGLTAGVVLYWAWELTSALLAIAVGALAGFVLVFQIDRWLNPNRHTIARRVASLEALGALLEQEIKTGRPPSVKLSRAIAQVAADLDAIQIPHPNWHNLDVMPILAWIGYVDKLLPALRRRNLREARTVIDHIDMARGLKP